ncbi:DUF2141 domain-containing protein [Algoriphagus namhaensis]
MKKYLFTLVLLSVFSLCSFAQKTHNLTVEVKSIKKVTGQMSICIVNEKEQFMESCHIGKNVPIESKDFFIVFEDLPEGKYAISVYHDEDSNGKLNMGKIVPVPTEKYGFSNNPNSTFGPPSFEECVFTLDKDMIVAIDL